MVSDQPLPTSFSPHTRGCSCAFWAGKLAENVFPAYAGMFLKNPGHKPRACSFPRIRGDVPDIRPASIVRMMFSPHTRGCSSAYQLQRNQGPVFPAYAGMFLGLLGCGSPPSSFPRIRGDVPWLWTTILVPALFSPHTRGCSPSYPSTASKTHVFPAYAGMFRWWRSQSRGSGRFPRIRGDVPGSRLTV